MNDSALQIDSSYANLVPQEISLQLPFDRLRTPQTEFRPANLDDVSIPWPSDGRVADGVQDAACSIAASVAMFFRYSGQSQIPVSVLVCNASSDPLSRTINLEVSGAKSMAHLQSEVATELKGIDGSAECDAASPVRISFYDQDSGDKPALLDLADDQYPDIHLIFVAGSDHLSISLDYNESLFDRETMARLLGHLKAVFVAVSASPSISISKIPIFSDNEESWFDARCNGPVIEFPHQPIHVEFEDCAALNPQKTAVRCADQGHADQLRP